MLRYRVGSEGVRIINPDGGGYSLPPGAVLDEIPHRYEGRLEVVHVSEPGTYDTAVIVPPEVK